MTKTPAQRVIAKFGGAAVVAELTQKHISRVFRWTYPKSRGGSGGFSPWAEAVKLLAFAPRHGVELTPADFFPFPTEPPPAVGPSALRVQACTHGGITTCGACVADESAAAPGQAEAGCERG